MANIDIMYFKGVNNRKLYLSSWNSDTPTSEKFLGTLNWVTDVSKNVPITTEFKQYYTVFTPYGNVFYLESGFSIIFANVYSWDGCIILGDDRGDPIFARNGSQPNNYYPIFIYQGGTSSANPIRTIVYNNSRDISTKSYYEIVTAGGTSTQNYTLWGGLFSPTFSVSGARVVPPMSSSGLVSGDIEFYRPDGSIFKTITYTDRGVFWSKVFWNVDDYNSKFTAYINADPNNPGGDNPYEPGGDSGSGGGNGSFDDTSDPVGFTPLPSLSVASSGFVGLYSPTLGQLQNLANYLWNNEINFDQLKKLVANPIDLLISLTIVPVSPPISGSESIKVGFIDTGISVNKISTQFITVDMGTLSIQNYFGSALDYSPFTKISIYLPFIGLRQLNVDDIMGTDIHLIYNIDLFTGACVAEIMVKDAVLYSFNGNISTQIPLASESFDQVFSAIINIATTVGTAVATGGASAASTAAETGGAITSDMAISAGISSTAKSLASSAHTLANSVMSAKPIIEHSGSMAGNVGLLSQKRPYLIYEIPRQSMPSGYQKYVGFPSNITAKLGDLSGFTVVEEIHLENINATEEELTEIESLLRGGVIL